MFFKTYQTMWDEAIETKSPILAWYLTRVRGLSVRSVRCTPYLVPMLGTMAYARCWILVTS
jgi:hypothetical protein